MIDENTFLELLYLRIRARQKIESKHKRTQIYRRVYAISLSSSWQAQIIAYVEMINILVALKIGHSQWVVLRVLIKCDNQAVIAALTNGKHVTLAKHTRNIFLWLRSCDIEIKLVHVAGKLDPVADLLSR